MPSPTPPPRTRRLAATGLALAATVLGGCANLGVQPWERELLAKPSMQLSGAMALEAGFDDHVYFSKEAATGGRGYGGGGCGCN